MANLAEIKKIAAKIHLTLDNPQSVREQLKEVKQAEKQLRAIKQEVVAEIRETKQPDNNFDISDAASIGLHIMGQHRLARGVKRQGKRAERRERKAQKNSLKPQIKMRDLIDNYLFESDRLKIMAEEYLKNH